MDSQRVCCQAQNSYGSINNENRRPTFSLPDSTSEYDDHPDDCTKEEAKMRRRLKYFFMTPCEKYFAKGRIPYKMIMQVLKIVVITIQLVIFGNNSASHVNFTERNIIAFHHLYIKGWDASFETLPYPPSHGEFAVYTYDEFYEMVNYAASQYVDTKDLALGTYDFTSYEKASISICKQYYREGEIFAFNQTYIFDSEKLIRCLPFTKIHKTNTTTNQSYEEFDAKEFLQENNMSINFDRMLHVWLNFSLKSVQLNTFDSDESPDCYRFDIRIVFDNTQHNGQVPVSLKAVLKELHCRGTVKREVNRATLIHALTLLLDVIVILLSVLSAILCVRSHVKNYMFYVKVKQFFLTNYKQKLDRDKYEFLNMWYVLIILNDILVICGSAYKIQLDNKAHCYRSSGQFHCNYWTSNKKSVDDYNICSYMLGLGSLLVWLGVLRYLSFSYKTNILILTIKRSGPPVLRFIFCALVIYMAFALCGWVILGPYHLKFRSFYSTLECLFSLVNGDDMFTTFSIINDDDKFIFYFARVFLYTFISLFIYVILNLFITLIIEAYEEVKALRYNRGKPDSLMWQFIRKCPENARSRLFLSDDMEDGLESSWRMKDRLVTLFTVCTSCCRRRKVISPTPGEWSSYTNDVDIEPQNGGVSRMDSIPDCCSSENTHLLRT